jgi:hypothetical protein
MNLMFINITAKVGDNETMSRKNNLRHQTLEAHPHNGDHGRHQNDGEDDEIGPGSKGAGGFGGNGWHGGNGENGDGDENCCDGFSMGCVIHGNDPRVHYGGSWVLEGTKLSTTHNTVVEGSTVSLLFNGKLYKCPLRDPDTQLS